MHCVQVLLVAAGLGKLRQEVQLVGRFAARRCWLHALMFLQQLLQRCSIFWRWGDRGSHQEAPGDGRPFPSHWRPPSPFLGGS